MTIPAPRIEPAMPVAVTSTSAAGGPVLRLLGGFALTGTGVPAAVPARTQRLLALLALQARPLPRSVVAARLWPDTTTARAYASLRSTLWGFSSWRYVPVRIDGAALRLDPLVAVDLTTAEAAAAAVAEPDPPDPGPAAEALLCRDLLPDWDDDFLLLDRERFRQLRLHALEDLADRHARAGRYARAVGCALAAVASDRLRESAHRALMLAHLAEGNAAEAIRTYHAYVAVLREEMGIAPSPLIQQLFARCLAVDDDLVATA